MSFCGLFFFGLALHRYYTPTMFVRVIPPRQLEYRLKSSITLYPTVGSHSNIFKSLRGLFFSGLALHRYYTSTTSIRAKPPRRLEYRLKSSISLDPTVGSHSNIFRSFHGLFSFGLALHRYYTPTISVRAIALRPLEYGFKRYITLDSMLDRT